ncbi:MAG: AI-2E family transporter [Anaerolineae bacterium]|nr:AI-2E family transporter [Anaerolineae bacterium]
MNDETPINNAAPVHAPLTRWDRNFKRNVAVGMILTGLLLIYLSRAVIATLIMAAILAYLIHPMVNRLMHLRLPRGLVTGLVYLFVVLLLIFVPIILIPVLIEQISTIQIPWNDLYVGFLKWFEDFPLTHPSLRLLGFEFDLGPWYQRINNGFSQFQIDQIFSPETVINYISQALRSASTVVGVATGVASNVVVGIFTSLLAFLLTLLYSFYMVKDAPRMRAWVEGLFPATYQPEMQELMQRLGRIWQSFFRGQLVLCLTIGTVTTLALAIIGMPGAILLGLLAGILEIIPNLGPIIAMVPALLVALLQGSITIEMSNTSFALLTVGVYVLIQQAENNILVPRIIGQSVNLHPLVVLVGVIVGATQAGILGAFLAAPVLATLRVVAGYMYAKLLDLPPFPAPDAPSAGTPPGWRQRLTSAWQGLQQRLARAAVPAQSNADAPAAETEDTA